MSELIEFGSLGIRHILDPRGIDHLLFLLALAAGYRLAEWRRALWVVSAFTIGHSLSLAVSVLYRPPLPAPLVEFLIPVTIVAAGIASLARGHTSATSSPWAPLLAGGFGLVHGAGFATYLRSLFDEAIALPLLGFNLGIEVAQVLVLLAAALVLAAADRGRLPLRVGVSAGAALAAAVMAAGRVP